MTDSLIINAIIVNEGIKHKGYVAINQGCITAVESGDAPESLIKDSGAIIDANGKYLLPGVIDDQVHFREPGLTHKAEIATESMAAISGGTTSFMDMPNCKPQTIDCKSWRWKMDRASDVSYANYSFWIGATNDNTEELLRADYNHIPGVKIFLGASTGNMLVNSDETLERIFSLPHILAVHSEDEEIIKANINEWKRKYGENQIPISAHPLIRSREACVESTRKAISRAKRQGSRLHLLHLSTADEARMLSSDSLEDKQITAEVCVHHLWFTDNDYERLGSRIKWNPAIKTSEDRDELRRAVADGRIDIVATDHAPHLPQEKSGDASTAASGGPLVEHSLLMMLELASEGHWGIEKVAEMMAHRPAILFGVKDRGFIRPGYKADLVLVDCNASTPVTSDTLLTKCGWSPLEGHTFPARIDTVWVNGHIAMTTSADGSRKFSIPHGEALEFIHR